MEPRYDVFFFFVFESLCGATVTLLERFDSLYCQILICLYNSYTAVAFRKLYYGSTAT